MSELQRHPWWWGEYGFGTRKNEGRGKRLVRFPLINNLLWKNRGFT